MSLNNSNPEALDPVQEFQKCIDEMESEPLRTREEIILAMQQVNESLQGGALSAAEREHLVLRFAELEADLKVLEEAEDQYRAKAA